MSSQVTQQEPAGLAQSEAFARIRLLRSPNVGPITYAQLLRRFGTAEAALEALPELTAPRGRSYRIAPGERVEAEIGAVRRSGARYLFHDSPDYPPLLREIESAPPILIVRGDAALLHRPCVAVVGARNASAAAIKLAREFSQALSAQGLVVVSGLARGIDGAAHRGALAGAAASAESGGTVGVIASGIDVVYPHEHRDLQEEIAVNGLLLAEQPPGTEPLARHFPSRNRIIAGMALGTIVVEAAPRSGSLITARLAGEAGREVMAIPGSPLDPRSQGCNQLIREGAVLVQTPDDVMELISTFDGLPRSVVRESGPMFDGYQLPEESISHDPADISALLTSAPVAVDELIRLSGQSASSVQLALLELELIGKLVRHAGGRVSLSGA